MPPHAYIDLRNQFLDSWIRREPDRFELADQLLHSLGDDTGRDPAMASIAQLVCQRFEDQFVR
jgi:hypothetical protein